MKRVVLAVLVSFAAAAAAPLAVSSFTGSPPPAGAVKGKARVLAWTPAAVRAAYADAGFVFAQQGSYVMFDVRAWYDPDSGTVGLPSMPDGVQVLRITRAPGGCTDPTLCADYTPGTVDPVAEAPLDCACSTGAQCFVPQSDGGLFPDGGPRPQAAPLGVTFDTFRGTGCVRKACTELWTAGGSSWPAECPCPSLQPDGGGGC